MKALFMPNFEKNNSAVNCDKIITKLTELGVETLIGENNRGFIEDERLTFCEFYKALRECDFIIALGGDGTILHSAKHALEEDKALLGINAGRLGFMAGLEIGEIDKLEAIAADKYTIQERSVLSCKYISRLGHEENYLALNDIVASHGTLSRMVDLELECDGKKIMEIRADGIIFSTPTGSTAYSLSAGGPIIDPLVDCIAITPICSHSIFNKTVVFKPESVFTLQCSPTNRDLVYMTADGADGIQLLEGDKLIVRKSDKKIKFIRFDNKIFYEALSDKFLKREQ